jgi:hypothetical protein
MEFIAIENANYWRAKDKRVRVAIRRNQEQDKHCSKNRIWDGISEIVKIKKWWTLSLNWKTWTFNY